MPITQNRKSFFKTLGLLGAGTLLSNTVFAKKDLLGSFESERSVAPKRAVRVAHLTDIHVSKGRVPEFGMAKVLNEVNTLLDKPDFIMNGGDAIMNAATISLSHHKQQWNVFNTILTNENSLPVKHCIGNHDIFSWALPDKDHAIEKDRTLHEYGLKKSYYSFSKNGWHFIVLDSIHGRKSIPGYYGKIDDEQFAWLENELSNTPQEMHVCIISHIPILAICVLFDSTNNSNNNWSVPDNALHADADKLTALFYKYKNVKACLSGHIHLIDHVNYLGIDYYCNGAVSGSWWKGDYKQFAPSFSLMNFYEDGTTKRENHFYSWKEV